jgi:hypothetical protein
MATKPVASMTAHMNAYAECDTCTWRRPISPETTKAVCTEHVRATGHRVTRILQTLTMYYVED